MHENTWRQLQVSEIIWALRQILLMLLVGVLILGGLIGLLSLLVGHL